jgi:hypothetical protein
MSPFLKWDASSGAAPRRAPILLPLPERPASVKRIAPKMAEKRTAAPEKVFQRLENFFPMVGKIGPFFPMIGKNFRGFSNDWKKSFQWLENFFPAAGRRGAERRGWTSGREKAIQEA